MKFSIYICLLINIVSLVRADGILSDAMKKSIVKLGEACLKTVGATLEEVEPLRDGPPYEGKAACVLACIFDKAGIMKGKQFSKNGFMMAVTPFIFTDPRKIKRMREVSGECEKEVSLAAQDECQAANHVVICLRKKIPQLAEIKF